MDTASTSADETWDGTTKLGDTFSNDMLSFPATNESTDLGLQSRPTAPNNESADETWDGTTRLEDTAKEIDTFLADLNAISNAARATYGNLNWNGDQLTLEEAKAANVPNHATTSGMTKVTHARENADKPRENRYGVL